MQNKKILPVGNQACHDKVVKLKKKTVVCDILLEISNEVLVEIVNKPHGILYSQELSLRVYDLSEIGIQNILL